jgi:large subunit ribosomal protein L16
MALLPKRSTYRKVMRGVVKGNATRGNFVAFGEAGLQSLDPGWITGRQIEAARIAISRSVGKAGKYWIRIFPHKPVSAKPLETRQRLGTPRRINFAGSDFTCCFPSKWNV